MHNINDLINMATAESLQEAIDKEIEWAKRVGNVTNDGILLLIV